MLVNEYRLEIQFKKVRKVQHINNIISMVGSRPLECRPAEHMRRTDFTWSLTIAVCTIRTICNMKQLYVYTIYTMVPLKLVNKLLSSIPQSCCAEWLYRSNSSNTT